MGSVPGSAHSLWGFFAKVITAPSPSSLSPSPPPSSPHRLTLVAPSRIWGNWCHVLPAFVSAL